MARRSRLFGKLVSVVCAASLCTTLSFPCEALGGTDEETVGLAGNGGEISVAQDADLSPETSNVDAGSSEVIEGEAASNGSVENVGVSRAGDAPPKAARANGESGVGGNFKMNRSA